MSEVEGTMYSLNGFLMCIPKERIVNAFGWCFSGIFLIILPKTLRNDIVAEL